MTQNTRQSDKFRKGSIFFAIICKDEFNFLEADNQYSYVTVKGSIPHDRRTLFYLFISTSDLIITKTKQK